jgi:hypothetical protein
MGGREGGNDLREQCTSSKVPLGQPLARLSAIRREAESSRALKEGTNSIWEVFLEAVRSVQRLKGRQN